MSKPNSRRTYDAEFKNNAINLCREPDKSVQSVADSLGITAATIYRWQREAGEKGKLAFPGNGREALTPEQAKIKVLEKQLKDAQMERDILKKAVGIFSRVPK